MEKSRWRLRLGLLLGSFVFFLVVAEIGLRVAGFTYEPMTVVPQNDSRGRHAFKDSVFVQDPALIWRPKPGAGPFNTLGYRGEELSEQPAPGEYRVLVVGDSNTAGWYGGFENNSNWPGELAKLVKEDDSKATVINAGAYGYTAFQGLTRLQEMLKYQPDLVLISFGSNDCHPVGISDADYVSKSVGFAAPWALKLRLGHALASFWDRRQAPEHVEGIIHRVGVAEYKKYLREMVELCRAHSIPCALLTRPYIGTADDPMVWKTYAPEYRQATLDVGSEMGVPVVDVYQAFHDRENLFSDESHFTQEGHQLAGQFIYEQLKPLIDKT